MNKQRLICCWLLSSVLFFCAGCANSRPGKYTIRIQRADALKDIAIQVDVIGLPKDEKDKYEKIKVNDYWSQVLSGIRDPNAITLQFSPGKQEDKVLKAAGKTDSDRKYKDLLDKRIWHLVIISNYPSTLEEKETETNDPRRRIVSLNKKEHRMGTKELTIQIQKSGITSTTQ